jgi:hypothetical protein
MKESIMAKEMSFIDVLNNPEGRRLVDAIEDTLSSLRGRPNGEPVLESILQSQIDDLEKATGYKYEVPRKS